MLWDMSFQDMLVSTAFFTCFAYITGWLADRILLHLGFGTIGNWLLVLIGAYAGMFAINMQGYNLEWNPLLTVAVIIGSASGLLLLMCMVKRVFSA